LTNSREDDQAITGISQREPPRVAEANGCISSPAASTVLAQDAPVAGARDRRHETYPKAEGRGGVATSLSRAVARPPSGSYATFDFSN